MKVIVKSTHHQVIKLSNWLLTAVLTANCLLLLVVSIAELLPTVSSANTYTVTSNLNGTTVDGVSLRWAITEANNNAGADIIVFSAGGTITLTSLLPALIDNAGVTIDGGGTANTNLTGALNGTLIRTISGGTLAAVITISSDNNIIKGLNFTMGAAAGANDAMINITAGANNRILGCYIGTNLSGTANGATTTEYGVLITNAANNMIGDGTEAGRNLISGLKSGVASAYSIYITGASATGNTIKGNIIGLQKDGITYFTTTQRYGVYFASSASGNIIGGTAAGDVNVISGNSYGIYFNSAAAGGNSALGNIIGPQADGTTKVTTANQVYGVFINGSPNNTIGGSAAGARNIISANGSYGFYITGAGSTGNSIKGNYIGLNSAGTAPTSGTNQNTGVYLVTSAANNTIGGTAAGEGNVISGNNGRGVYFFNSGGGNSVLGNILGPQANGTGNLAPNSQLYGVFIDDSPNNTIGGSVAGARNIISANLTYGIYITDALATGNSVKGNYIGLDITGTVIIAGSNQDYGVYITNPATGNTFGGSGAGEGNVISGNALYGFYSTTGAGGSSILGNIIGPQADGTSMVASNTQSTGVYISATPNNIIGGTGGARNIISANDNIGIYITGGGSTGNSVKGNYIGLDITGTVLITGNSQNYGIYLANSAASTSIGGTAAGEGNVISGNTNIGIYLTSTAAAGNSVLGNIIGPQKDGISNVASNAQNNGIYISSSPNNTIGGSAAGAGNIIAYHLAEGVVVNVGNGNLISRNSFFCNSQTSGIAGIILFNGGNNSQAAPVIVTANTTTITGTSTANATIEIFIRDDVCSKCEGKTYNMATTADGAGNWTASGSFIGYVVATATSAAGNNTSQFSNCVGPLPIELLYFNALLEGSAVKTYWSTATEINNDYFAVQRSQDGTTFWQIGTIQGAGNSFTIQNYIYYDHEPNTGISYYRLKQVDFNGQYTYSQIVPIFIGPVTLINLYPNPAGDDGVIVLIGAEEDMQIDISVADAIGNEVIKFLKGITKGYTQVKIDTRQLASGIYLFKAVIPSKEKIQKQFAK